MTVALIVKVTITLGLTLLGMRAVRQSRAATRHFVLATAFGIAALLPVAAVLAPIVRVEVPAVSAVVQDYLRDSLPIAALGDDSGFLALDASGSIRGQRVTLPQVLLTVWAAGVVLFLMPVLVGLFQLSRLRRTGLPWTIGQGLIDGLARDAGLRRRITVLCHERIPAPATGGLRNPAIFFPVDAARWSDDDMLRAAVHEVEHVRRWDSGVSAMARIVVAVYWFHPLAWVAWRRLNLEAERACDDAVLRRSECTEYVDQLIALAARLAANPSHPLLAMANRSDLVHRVSALLDGRQARGRLGRVAAAVISLAAIVLMVIIAPLRAAAVTHISIPRELGQRLEAPSAVQYTQPRPLRPAGGQAVQSSGGNELAADRFTAKGLPLSAQGPRVERPVFEVASVRPNSSDDQPTMSVPPRGSVVLTNVPLQNLIVNAYGVPAFRVVGGPDWIRRERFDIAAKPRDDAAEGQARLMLQGLLEERFSLRVHREMREQQVYALVLATADGQLGVGLRRSSADCPSVTNGNPIRLADSPGSPCGGLFGVGPGGGSIVSNGQPLSRLISALGMAVGRTVIDRTGLEGAFDLQLKWTSDVDTNVVTRDGAPSIFTALQEQLGLKLEPGRAPVEVLVIDSVERPGPD
jgi:uncharacterized protein (TIGR03435 family)